MAQIGIHRTDHLANAAFGALALGIVVATLHLLGIAPMGTQPGATNAAGRIHAPAMVAPAAVAKDVLPREETLVQVPAGRLGVSWHVPAVVSRPAVPPPRPAAP